MTVKENTSIQHIIFDLDDTLLDTSRLLVPSAIVATCRAMIKAGMKCTLSQCLPLWQKDHLHSKVIAKLASKYGDKKRQKALIQCGLSTFYKPKIGKRLPISSEALICLKYLVKNQYSLSIITRGDPLTQSKKIKALTICKYFQAIYIVNIDAKKEWAFLHVLSSLRCRPENVLCVGNRLDDEIETAKRLGIKTCWIKKGEHSKEKPKSRYQKPDFKITSLGQLVTLCQL